MNRGPVELLVVKFPRNQLRGGIVPALADLVRAGTIRIIDLMVAVKDDEGELTILELGDLSDDEYAALDPLVESLSGMLAEDDARELAASLEPNSSIGLLLFEHTWVRAFRGAVATARGEIVMDERIPGAVIDALAAAQPTAQQ